MNKTSHITRTSSIIALLMTVVACGYSFGQIDFGIKAGINSDHVKPVGLYLASAHPLPTIGIHGGMFVEGGMGEKWNLLMELQYIRKGSRSIFPQLPINKRINFEYFDLSVLPGLKLTNRLSVEGGPTLTVQTRLFLSEPIISPSESIQFAMNLGLKFQITAQVIMIARYYHALTPFQNYRISNASNQYEGTSQFYYRTVELSLAYVMGKKN